MSRNLLRRPLPPLKKEPRPIKNDVETEKYKHNQYLEYHQGTNEKHTRSFDISENRNLLNLMKPLGPQPFYTTKWLAKKKPMILQQREPQYSYWSISVLESQDVEEKGDDDDEEEEEINEKEKSNNTEFKKEIQDILHIINIESEKLPKVILKKPWRQILIEQTSSAVEERYWGKDADLLEELSIVNQIDLPIQFDLKENEQSFERSTKIGLQNSVKPLHKQFVCDEDNNEVEDVTTSEFLEEDYLYQKAKKKIEGNLKIDKSFCCFTMKEEVDYELKDVSQEHVKLNLKAQFLDLVPELSSAVMSSLTWINLSFNDFMKVPGQIFYAENLIYLNMRNNPLFEIPDNIALLKKLKYANFSFCCIQNVNEKFYELKELEVLDLSHNRIVGLSGKIEHLQSLKELFIEGNQIRTLPKNILKLKLSYLHCSSNFLNKAFWKESCPVIVQSLFELSINTVLSYGVKDRSAMKIQFGMKFSSEKCDYCNGPKPLHGVSVLKPVVELFSAKNIPIMFYVCSQSCRKQLITAPQLPCHASDDEEDGEMGEENEFEKMLVT